MVDDDATEVIRLDRLDVAPAVPIPPVIETGPIAPLAEEDPTAGFDSSFEDDAPYRLPSAAALSTGTPSISKRFQRRVPSGKRQASGSLVSTVAPAGSSIQRCFSAPFDQSG